MHFNDCNNSYQGSYGVPEGGSTREFLMCFPGKPSRESGYQTTIDDLNEHIKLWDLQDSRHFETRREIEEILSGCFKKNSQNKQEPPYYSVYQSDKEGIRVWIRTPDYDSVIEAQYRSDLQQRGGKKRREFVVRQMELWAMALLTQEGIMPSTDNLDNT